MNSPSKILKVLLMMVGMVQLGALVPLFIPHAWMDWVHRQIGLGELPAIPIVAYLTRTECGLYAIMGAVLICAATDVRRYVTLIRLLGILYVAGGTGMMILDFAVGMPTWWSLLEGPAVITMGMLWWVLGGKVPDEE